MLPLLGAGPQDRSKTDLVRAGTIPDFGAIPAKPVKPRTAAVGIIPPYRDNYTLHPADNRPDSTVAKGLNQGNPFP